MKTEHAVEFFVTKTALAEALGTQKSTISNWGDVVPRGRAFELQVITDGKLKVDPSLYQKPVNVA